MISHPQLRSLGISQNTIEYWLNIGYLIRLHANVYAVGHDSLTRRGQFMAAVLACGPGAALSHRSAAQHWALIRMDQHVIDVSAARSRKRATNVRLHRPTRIGVEDVTVHDGIPITTVGRTLIDLAGCMPYGITERAWQQAEILRLLDVDEVVAAIERGGRKPGRRKIAQLVAIANPLRESAANVGNEQRLLRGLQSSCPVKPEVNVYVEDMQVDFFFRLQGLIVEVDDRTTHETTMAFERDRERDRTLQLAGYRVLRFTTNDLRSRMSIVIEQVNAALDDPRNPTPASAATSSAL